MANITLNVNGTVQNFGTLGTSANYTGATIAAGTDRGLVATICTRQAITGLTMTWDSGGTNQSMTQLVSQKQDTWDEYCYIFGLLAPTTGALTLAASWTGSAQVVIDVVCFNNVNQTNIATAFPDANDTTSSGNSANPSASITTASGDATVSALSNSGSVTAVNQTSIYFDLGHGAAQYALSTGTSDTHTYTMTSSNWGFAGVHVVSTNSGKVSRNTRSNPLGTEIGMNWSGNI